MFDFIFNPEVLKNCKAQPTMRQLVYELCLNHLSQKYKQNLSVSKIYVEYLMPKMKYKGQTVEKQRVRAKKAPKIEVIDKEIFKEPQGGPRKPDWKMHFDNQELDPENLLTYSSLQLLVDLPLLITGKAINLQISPEAINITVGTIYELKLWLPFECDSESIQSQFDCISRQLSVSMSHKSLVEESEVSEKAVVELTPIELSSHNLLYDII